MTLASYTVTVTILFILSVPEINLTVSLPGACPGGGGPKASAPPP